MIEIICPNCKKELKCDSSIKKKAINDLYKLGYGIREIQRMFGYKSPATISHHLDKPYAPNK